MLSFRDEEVVVYMTYIYNPGYFCIQREDSIIDDMSAELQKYCQVKWASSWDCGTYHIGDQRRLRRDCAFAQSRQSLRCSLTWSMEVRQRVRPKIRCLAPFDGCACTFEEWVYGGQKSTIISWDGSSMNCDYNWTFVVCPEAVLEFSQEWTCKELVACKRKKKIWAASWQNQQNYLWAQQRLRSAWASAQSDQSLSCALSGYLRTQALFMGTGKTDQSGCPDWSESSLGAGLTCHFVGFVMRRLICWSNCGCSSTVRSPSVRCGRWFTYCKNPKNLDTWKHCCNDPKVWTRWLYDRVMHPQDADRMANSVDWTPENLAVMTQKFEQDGFTIE